MALSRQVSISKLNIKKEIVNELRSADLISTSIRGVTTTTEEFNGDGAETTFTLTGTGLGNGGIKNIRTVTIGGVSQAFGTDWIMSDDFSDIVFTTAPASGTNNVDITYDYSTDGDRIYPDYALTVVSTNDFPRIGFDIISTSTSLKALRGAITQTNMLLSFVSYGVGATSAEILADSVRSFLNTKKNSWFYLNALFATSEGPIIPATQANNKIYQRNVDFSAPFEFET